MKNMKRMRVEWYIEAELLTALLKESGLGAADIVDADYDEMGETVVITLEVEEDSFLGDSLKLACERVEDLLN